MVAPLREAAFPLLILPAGMMIVFAVHELGHAVVAALLGQKLVLLVIGPIKVMRLQGRLRLGLNRCLAYWGGMALSAPPGWRGTMRYRRESAAILGAGPLASMAFGAACLATAMVRSDFHARLIVQSPTLFTTLTIGAMSLGVGLVTIGPGLFTKAGRSDGARLREFLGDRGELDVERILAPLMHLLRPSEWHPHLVRRLQEAFVTHPTMRNALLLHRWALDVGREDDARAFLAQAEALANVAAERTAWAVDASLYAALWHRDSSRANEILNETGVSPDETAALIAFAAVASTDGRVVDATRMLREFERRAWDTMTPALILTHAAALDRMPVGFGRQRI